MVTAWSQDTIPMGKKNSGSNPGIINNRRDTLPTKARNNADIKDRDNRPGLYKDTTSLGRRNKIPDTSFNRNSNDEAQSVSDMSNRNFGEDSLAVTNNRITDRVIMKDDKIIVVKNGDSTLLEDSVTLESEAVIIKNGSVIYSSGKTVQLKNGQYISFSNPVDNNSRADSTTPSRATMENKGTARANKTNTAESNSKSESTTITKTDVVEDKIVIRITKCL